MRSFATGTPDSSHGQPQQVRLGINTAVFRLGIDSEATARQIVAVSDGFPGATGLETPLDHPAARDPPSCRRMTWMVVSVSSCALVRNSRPR